MPESSRATGTGVRTAKVLGAGCCGRGGERRGDAWGRRSLGATPGHRVPRAPQPPAGVGAGAGVGAEVPPRQDANLARGGRRITYWPRGLKLFLEMLATKYWLCPCSSCLVGDTESPLRGPRASQSCRTREARAQRLSCLHCQTSLIEVSKTKPCQGFPRCKPSSENSADTALALVSELESTSKNTLRGKET